MRQLGVSFGRRGIVLGTVITVGLSLTRSDCR